MCGAGSGRTRFVSAAVPVPPRLTRAARDWFQDDEEERADWQHEACGEPRAKLFPAPRVHADLAMTPTLAAPQEDRAAIGIQAALSERERFTDPEPGSPEHDNQSAFLAPNKLSPV